jgi:hypothetical protein
MQTITTAFRDLKTALAVNTQGLCPDERTEARKLAEMFSDRLACEEWAGKLGWDIPAYGSAEWMEMQSAFLND